jgi:hypothetical protein
VVAVAVAVVPDGSLGDGGSSMGRVALEALEQFAFPSSLGLFISGSLTYREVKHPKMRCTCVYLHHDPVTYTFG